MTEREFSEQICKRLNNYFSKRQYSYFEGEIILKAEPIEFKNCKLIKVNGLGDNADTYVLFAVKLKTVPLRFVKTFINQVQKIREPYFYGRFGVLLGKANCIPDSLIDKISSFDFLFSLENEIPPQKEFEEFAKMICEEIRDAIRLRKAFYDIKESPCHKVEKRVSIDLK